MNTGHNSSPGRKRIDARLNAIARWRALALWSLLVVAPLAVAPGEDIGPETASPDSHQWAILIGAQGYEHLNRLSHTNNDCGQLMSTLLERGGVPYDHIMQIVDNPGDPLNGPRRSGIMHRMEFFLEKAQPEDQVFVFFSGHGCQDVDGKLYLAAIDTDPARLAETGIPIEWLRDRLAACEARFKLLVLDACHAGADKGGAPVKGVAGKDLGEPFRDLTGVVTLASSTADESSLEWAEKQQSLFTFWLNQGLRGHADENGDGQLDVDELNKYVHRNVTHTARVKFNHSQTPVRIVRSLPGVPVVLRLRPRELDQVLADMAEQIVWALDEHHIGKVAVPEFLTDTPEGEGLGSHGGLGKLCAEELEQHLLRLADGRFSVVSAKRLQEALGVQKFKVSDYDSTTALAQLSNRAENVPVFVKGILRSRQHRIITLQCKLEQMQDDGLLASVGGKAWLNENQWALLGLSADLRPGDVPVAPPTDDSFVAGPSVSQVVAVLDHKAEGPHPLSDPKFRFPVRMIFGGRERRGVFRGNDCIVGVRAGETFEIQVENRTGEPVCMRLLVDGLNTLPEEIDVKGVTTLAIAPRVSLDQARHWVLDPNSALMRRYRKKVWSVRGFVTQTGTNGKLRKFTVVDAQHSIVKNRQEFTDQLGLITVAFYKAEPLARGAVIDPGEARPDYLQEDNEYGPGELISVVNIRYVDESALSNPEPSEAPAPSPAGR